MLENDLERKNKSKRKNTSLTLEEKLTFFILPFFTTKPNYRDDHFSQSELERFKEYGFDNKIREAEKIKKYGFLFWIATFILIIILIS